jgi:hypothetical protein
VRRRPLIARVGLLALLLFCASGAALLATPGFAVVGGRVIEHSSAPWFVRTGLCGGTLIAPARIATAAHCFDPVDMADIRRIRVGGVTRMGVRVALPPTWRTRRVGFALDDIAIVQLDRPVTGVRPAALPPPSARVSRRVRVLGQGQIAAPAPGKRAPSGVFRLRQAILRSIGDPACDTAWRRSGTRYRTRFEAALMVCAIDADGRGPRASVCAGDSGGPLVSGSLARPVLLGVISWTGPRCGADRLPSVAAEVDHYRAFLADPDPVWAPVPGGPVRVTGDARVGGTLNCEISAWEVAPEQVEIRWLRRTRSGRSYLFTPVGGGPSYVVQRADAAHLVRCEARGSTAGGRTVVPSGPESATRVVG